MTKRQVVCDACGGVNRLPPGRDPTGAKCGRCGARLFEQRPIDVRGGQLTAHLRGDRGGAVLVDVWAPWCGPCRTMAPQFAAAARELEPEVRLLKLDSQANPQTGGELRVSSIPTLILFRDGREVARQSGALSAGQIVAWTRQALAQATA